jgi:SAM-dependent methyltransferase
MNPAEFANIAQSEQTFWWYRGMNRILFALLDPIAAQRRFDRVLEAGCGTGYLSKLLRERYKWPMFPIDLGWEGLQFGRSLAVDCLTQADLARLPFRDAVFGAVLSMDVIVHFQPGAEGRAFEELVRVLAPGGLLVIRVSALRMLRSRHSQFADEKQRFTRRRLVSLAQANGIEVLRCTYLNSLLLPVALAKFRVWEPLLRRPPASGVGAVHPALNGLLEQPLNLEAKWLARGRNFPVGQSLLLLGEKR